MIIHLSHQKIGYKKPTTEVAEMLDFMHFPSFANKNQNESRFFIFLFCFCDRPKFLFQFNSFRYILKGTLMQIWKSVNMFVFIWKEYAEGFAVKHLLLSELHAREICEKFVYKHSETIEYKKLAYFF